MDWSKYQEAIFKDTSSGKGNLIVEAKAGCAKTTTLIESLNHIPPDKSWLLVAFNKKIATELQQRAPASNNGDCRTLHSLGLKTCFKRWPNIRVEPYKMNTTLNSVVGTHRRLNDLKWQVQKAVGFAKANLVSDPDDIDELLDLFDVDTLDVGKDIFIDYVCKSLLKSFENTSCLDYSDMIWFPNQFDLTPDQYDFVLIDEAQDLSKAQLTLAMTASTASKTSRIIIYSDKKQAIYSFAGVSTEGFEEIVRPLKARKLPLSISYRCPKKVIKEAQRFAPEIEAAPNAKEGIVEKITYAEMFKIAKPGCFIISRANAPLIGIALHFINKGIPANIQGRDIGSNLLNIIKKSRCKKLDSLLTWLDKWKAKEIKRLLKDNKSIGTVTDKYECLHTLAESCSSVDEIKRKIETLFEDTDTHNVIMCSTTHKAKGLERDVVFMISATFRETDQEEKNLKYVCITRSKNTLYYVIGKK